MISNKSSVAAFVALAVVAARGGFAMLTVIPAMGWTLFALCVMCMLMTVEMALDMPVSDSLSARARRRRQERRDAQDAADRQSHEAAFQAGLEKTRAYVRERDRQLRVG